MVMVVILGYEDDDNDNDNVEKAGFVIHDNSTDDKIDHMNLCYLE
jgi:hypothetical protein